MCLLYHDYGIMCSDCFWEKPKYNREYKLYIVGDTHDKNYKEYLHEIVEDQGLFGRTVFLGNRDDVYMI
jgi:glycosyltransferase involved in cell wall biosynthesis